MFALVLLWVSSVQQLVCCWADVLSASMLLGGCTIRVDRDEAQNGSSTLKTQVEVVAGSKPQLDQYNCSSRKAFFSFVCL